MPEKHTWHIYFETGNTTHEIEISANTATVEPNGNLLFQYHPEDQPSYVEAEFAADRWSMFYLIA